MQKIYTWAVMVAFFWVCGCTTVRPVGPTPEGEVHAAERAASVSQASSDVASRPLLEAMTLQKVAEGTLLEFPAPTPSEVFVDYDMGRRFVVHFTPAVPEFIPAAPAGVVQRVGLDARDGMVSSVTVDLMEPVRYLLSREGARARLLLAPAEAERETVPPPASTKPALVDAVEFATSEHDFSVLLSSSAPIRVTPGPKGEAFAVVLPGAQFSPAVAKVYRIEGGQPIERVQALNVGSDAQLVFTGVTRPAFTVAREGGVTRLRLAVERGGSPSVGTAQKMAIPAATAASEPQDPGTIFPGMKKEYHGTPITLDLQEAKVEHVLRLLSEIAGYNLILDEGVTGTISLKLVDIPWDQALDLILLQKNLGMVKQGNLLRIATLEQLRRENEELQRAREAEARARESLENVLPTRTEFIQINYSTAAEFESKVRELLSPRGKISADSRTNTLIVTDIDPVLQKVQSYIAKLDRPERQVLIEARLVYATDDFQRDIGIKWGATMQDESARDDEQYQWDTSASGFNTPFGTTGLGLAGNIGKILGKDLWSLDASLRLGETKNLVKTVSSPRIVTLNNNRAEIKQGIKLATSGESESGGTTTEYTDAVLKISVQPQITPDNKLILDVEISDDSPTATGRDIETKSARTKMIVGDRETIVIGGVLKASDRSATEKIPGLGDVPVLGRLFRQDETASSKQELLIFLHPRIL